MRESPHHGMVVRLDLYEAHLAAAQKAFHGDLRLSVVSNFNLKAERKFLCPVSDLSCGLPNPEPTPQREVCIRMAQIGENLRSQSPEWGAPVCSVFGVVFATAAVLFFVLFNLLRPTVIPNPGLAAFNPSAGARLIPLPRESNAPEPQERVMPAPQLTSALSARAQAGAQRSKRSASPTRRR